MKKILLNFFCFLCLISTQAQGIFESYVIIDVNGAGGYYYNLAGDSTNDDFNTRNFGNFSTSNTLYLKGFEHKVWEDNCGYEYSRLYYKVEQTSQNSAPFVEISGTYNGPLGGNDHKWDNTTENINLLDGLSPGDYKITLYGQADTHCQQGPIYDSNNSANYTAYFSVSNYTTNTTISSQKSFNNIEIDANVTVTIVASGSLDISDTLTNNGTLILQSAASSSAALKVNSKAGSGTYIYQKYVASTGTNDLISAPFTGQTFSNLLGNNSSTLYTNPSDATEYLFGSFDNDTGAYLIYDSDLNGASQMTSGTGYRAATASGETLSFSGTFHTSNQTKAINVGAHATYGKWNLVGNPFPSYLNLSDFISDNTSVLESTNNAVYAYDGDNSDGSVWTIYSLNNSNDVTIAPGQGFFVASSAAGGNLQFNTNRQTVTGGDDFIQRGTNSTNTKAKIKLEHLDQSFHTDLYFNPNATLALDVGYDVGHFGNLVPEFGIYTQLASTDYQDIKFAAQAISSDFTDSVVIPLGIQASVGSGYTIVLDDETNLESIDMYIKDYETGALHLLNSGPYAFDILSTLVEASRFELRIGKSALSNRDYKYKENLRVIYSNDAVFLLGNFKPNDQIQVYDVVGRLTQSKSVADRKEKIEISKTELSKGIYVVTVQSGVIKASIKFMIK